MILEHEIDTYRRRLPELLAQTGKFVVIHGDNVIGTFDGLSDALRAGYEKSLEEPFLVREIREVQKILFTSRSLRPCRSSTEP